MKKPFKTIGIIPVFLFIIIGALVIYPICKYSSKETIEITVSDKERITTGSGEHLQSKYLIYTNREVLENTDAMLFWKFNSSDIQNQLKVGKTYKVEVVGWRVPFLSWYRNVVAVKKVVVMFPVTQKLTQVTFEALGKVHVLFDDQLRDESEYQQAVGEIAPTAVVTDLKTVYKPAETLVLKSFESVLEWRSELNKQYSHIDNEALV